MAVFGRAWLGHPCRDPAWMEMLVQGSATEPRRALGQAVGVNPAAWHAFRVSHPRPGFSHFPWHERQSGFEPGFCLRLR